MRLSEVRGEDARTAAAPRRPRLPAHLARTALSWAGILVSALFAYLAVRHVHFRDVWGGLHTSNYVWLVPAFLALAVTVAIRAFRWRLIFRPETRPSMRSALVALLLSYFFNSVLPARAGEAARIVVLRRRAGTSAAETTATVLIERAFDVLCLLGLLFVTVAWLPHVVWLHAAVLLAVALAAILIGLVIVLALYDARPLRILLRPLGRLPFLSRERVDEIAENFTHGFAALRRPKLALAAVFWTTLGWLTLALSTWFVMLGFSLHISIVGGLFVVIATNLALVLPSSPAAVGVFEAAVLVALRPYGISDSQALSYALVVHALNFVPFVAAGLFLLRGTVRGARSQLT